MDLAEQIAQMTDHLQFTQLCNAAFTALYPTSFQVVDGTRADQGNDGYVGVERMMLAYHCPTKPEKETDAKYVDKIEEDLSKAHRLHIEGRFEVKKWAFLTPRPLGNQVIGKMRAKASSLGVESISLSATFLADVLSRNREILHRFPFLHIPTIEETLKTMLEFLKEGKHAPPQQAATSPDIRRPNSTTDDFRQVLAIRSEPQADDSKARLRSIFYKSTDSFAQANAVLGILQWFDPSEDRLTDLVEWCDRGIAVTQSIGDKGHQAYFRAHKGYFLSAIYTMEDMQTYFSIRADHIIGLQTVTEEARQTVITRLRHLENAYTQEFSAALELLSSIGDLNLWGEALLPIGNAAGQRAFHFHSVGLREQSDQDKAICIRALMAAKEAFSRCGNELSVGFALHSLANQLRFFGESKEALDLIAEAQVIAEKHKDFRLEQATRLLRTTIESGRVPDYVHGERRERKK